MKCKAFTQKALRFGAKQESAEHPWAGLRTAKRIARDHLCENPKYYNKEMNLGDVYLFAADPKDVAGTVMEEVRRRVGGLLSEGAYNKFRLQLENEANAMYRVSPVFREAVQKEGAVGRNALSRYMKQWIAAALHKWHVAAYSKLPAGWIKPVR